MWQQRQPSLTRRIWSLYSSTIGLKNLLPFWLSRESQGWRAKNLLGISWDIRIFFATAVLGTSSFLRPETAPSFSCTKSQVQHRSQLAACPCPRDPTCCAEYGWSNWPWRHCRRHCLGLQALDITITHYMDEDLRDSDLSQDVSRNSAHSSIPTLAWPTKNHLPPHPRPCQVFPFPEVYARLRRNLCHLDLMTSRLETGKHIYANICKHYHHYLNFIDP